MNEQIIFAAHIKENKIQSVKAHCENVSKYASMEAQSIGLTETLKLIGLLHDVGKNCHSFDEYIHNAVSGESGFQKKINHSSAGGRYLYESIGDLCGSEILSAQIIAYAIISHHGLSDFLNLLGENCFEKRLYPQNDNNYNDVVSNINFVNSRMIRELFEKSVVEINDFSSKIVTLVKKLQDKTAGYFLYGCLQRLVLSLLVDADWKDTSEFMNDYVEDRISIEICLNKWQEYQSKLHLYISKFQSDSKLNLLRKRMSDQCFEFAKYGNGVYKLAIPTGGGKTLASMRYALELAKKEQKRHIYYIAPYLSILEQNARELKNIFADEINILEYHSNVILSDDETKNGHLLSENWSELIILTTMVQLLNTMFDDNMKSIRRFHQLKDSIIIIDEAQSIPLKCFCMFSTMINFLNYCCNTTVVICTATQPLFETLEHKMLYSMPSEMIADIDKYSDEFKRTTLINETKDSMDTFELAEYALSKLEHNMLIVLNTKKSVSTLYDELSNQIEDDTVLYQLTTYMCAAHRMDIIEEIKQFLHNKDKKIICISTQLIEAGVDISFETVVRSMAGLDSIEQAAGRCNRNAERPIGNVYIVHYEDENLSKLKEIKETQEATKLVLDRQNIDLSSRDAMKLYYKEFFYKNKNKMMFKVEQINDTLYNLLSYNGNHRPENYSYPMGQSLKQAGKYFQVIDNCETVGIIVPYKKAKKYIKDLEMTQELNEIKMLIKKLQRYTVNIYKTDQKFKSLLEAKAITTKINDNLLILNEMFYDKNGISEKLELLAF